VAGRAGDNHLFLVDCHGEHDVDCSEAELPYGRQLIDDTLHRIATAMPQAHVYLASRLGLEAEARAARLGYLAP
jgi:hypothetical protein